MASLASAAEGKVAIPADGAAREKERRRSSFSHADDEVERIAALGVSFYEEVHVSAPVPDARAQRKSRQPLSCTSMRPSPVSRRVGATTFSSFSIGSFGSWFMRKNMAVKARGWDSAENFHSLSLIHI